MRKDGKSAYQALNEKCERMKSQQLRCIELMTSAVESYEKIINSTPMILNIKDYGEAWKILNNLKLHLKELDLEELR